MSSSAVLVKGLAHVAPLVIAWWRCTGTATLMLPALRRVNGREALGIVVAGLCLAAHFVSWFASIHATSVLHSTLLVTLTPVWVGLVDRFVLGNDPGRAFWTGTAIAIPGVLLMSSGLGADATLGGDLLALVAGWLASAYVLAGRVVRRTVDMGTYGGAVPLVAALALTPVLWWSGEPVIGHDPTTWLLLAACVLGPQLIGHNGFNWALRYLPAPTVSSFLLLEPVGATLLAGLAFATWPGPVDVLGAAMVVLGVGMAVRGG
ncbi:MAG: EamA family transporter [Alphaproteobacteria bacterium]|nr:EamA family transporter [Alphaproteobacteria bacterium]